ncbi:unnamed protein product [Orchesella dallaii]|uniref:Uncharacterized protein n=1 Tax=Orchesella dallaii TaxID=48710 RepID=A0ABP1R3Q7_9HEXA
MAVTDGYQNQQPPQPQNYPANNTENSQQQSNGYEEQTDPQYEEYYQQSSDNQMYNQFQNNQNQQSNPLNSQKGSWRSYGSTYSLITSKLVKNLGLEIDYNSLIQLKCANSTNMKSIGTADIEIQLGRSLISHKFHVMSDSALAQPCIIGSDIIRKYGIVPNQQKGYFYFNHDSRTHYPLHSSEGLMIFMVNERKSTDFPNDSMERRIEKLLAQFPEVTRLDGSIGVPPALLVLGRNIPLPIDRKLRGDIDASPSEIVKTIVSTIPKSLVEILNHVKDKIRRRHQLNKYYFDKKRKEITFNVGDKVLVLNHQLSNAPNHISKTFLPLYHGPFEILKKINDSYIIKMPKKFNPKRHVSDLRPFVESKTQNDDDIGEESSEQNTQPGPKLRAKKPVDYREKDLRRK